MYTYEQAKALLDKAKNARNGIALPEKRVGRIFWEDPDNPRNRNIVVYLWRGYRHGGETMEERRRNADTYRDNEPRYYGYSGICPLITIMPNGNYKVRDANALRWRYGGDISRIVLPEGVQFGRVVLPDAGPPPKLRKVPAVEHPRFVAPNGWPYAKESREKARAHYEAQVAKYGSLEAWFEAHAKASQIRDANETRIAKWRSTKNGNTADMWDDVVFDANGQATKASVRWEKGREAREKREELERKEAARKEAARKKREWNKALKSADAQKIFNSLSEDMQTYFRLRQIIPNSDGTVTMMKFVNPDYSSHYDPRVVYTPGAVVEDSNFKATDHCGNGLHFAATVEDCDRWSGRYPGSKQILCNVDLSDAVLIGVYNRSDLYTEEKRFRDAKIKARKCLVLGDGDGTNSRKLIGHKPERKITPYQKRKNKQNEQENAELRNR